MSIPHVSAVLDEATGLDGTHLLVMLALAEYANGEGECYPSVASLAKRARRSERRVQVVIGDLIEWGLISARRTGGRGLATDYDLHLEAIRAFTRKGDADDTVSDGSKGDAGDTVSGPKGCSPVCERVKPATRKGDVATTPQPPGTKREPGDARERATLPPGAAVVESDLDGLDLELLGWVEDLGGKLDTPRGECCRRQWLDVLADVPNDTIERVMASTPCPDYPSRFRKVLEVLAPELDAKRRRAAEARAYCADVEARAAREAAAAERARTRNLERARAALAEGLGKDVEPELRAALAAGEVPDRLLTAWIYQQRRVAEPVGAAS